MTSLASTSRQTTLLRPAEFAGVGLFTGAPSEVRILPAPVDAGIRFQRVDLPGKPEIPARLFCVSETPRCTCLGIASHGSVRMVEHLLSALRGMGVDNARIELTGPEIPVFDGSSLVFAQHIEQAGLQALQAPRRVIRIEKPIYWSQGECHLIALPFDGYRVSYTLHYPQSPLIGSQYFSIVLNPESYQAEIASCRTFSLYEEILPLVEQGLLKGGGLENGLVIQGNRILNPEGSRFFNEMVRHKILDIIGDLSLLGAPIEGHILAVRSGHAANVAFAREIAKNTEGMK